MLRERIITAVAGIPILLGFLFLGELPFFLLVTLIVVLALIEFSLFYKKSDAKPDVAIVLFTGAAFCFFSFLYGVKGFLFGLILAAFLISMRKLFWRCSFPIKSVALTIFAPIYVGFLLSHLILIRKVDSYGVLLVLTVFLATWTCDISAYFLGSLFGKRKLAPKISPHKTWEGAIGGLLATALVVSCFWFIPVLNFFERILMGVVIAIFGQLGDLVESKLKRTVGAKDSGAILPGHGGILDRFDSLILSAPAAFYLMKVLLLR